LINNDASVPSVPWYPKNDDDLKTSIIINKFKSELSCKLMKNIIQIILNLQIKNIEREEKKSASYLRHISLENQFHTSIIQSRKKKHGRPSIIF